MSERELGVSCCRESCCSCDERTTVTVVDVMALVLFKSMGSDVVNEITEDEDKIGDDTADDDVDDGKH